MGFWKKKDAELEEMYKIVEAQQGASARGIAEEIGVSPSTVTRSLAGMEEAGYLLSEDDKGRLWPFGRRK